MYKVRFYCIDGAHYEYLEQETIDENVTCSTHPESEIRDFVVIEDMNDLKDAVALKHNQNTDIALQTDKFTVDADGKTHINTIEAEALRIGNGAVGVDYRIKFSGNNGDGEIIWEEAKAKFKIDCGLQLTGCYFVDHIEEYTLDAGIIIEGVLLKDGDLYLSGTGAVLTDGVNSATVEEIKDAVDKKHDHSNKTLLDTYTQTEIDIADAISKEHEHSNKIELDLVTDGDHDIRTDNPHAVTAGQIGYGTTYVEDETVSGTTDTAWQQKFRMNFTPPSTGNYLLEWSIEITNSKAGSSTFARIELDDTTQINHIIKEPAIIAEYTNCSGFKKLNFVDTNLHTIDVDFKAEADTASIRRVRLSMRKI